MVARAIQLVGQSHQPMFAYQDLMSGRNVKRVMTSTVGYGAGRFALPRQARLMCLKTSAVNAVTRDLCPFV